MFGAKAGERRLDKWGATRLIHLGGCLVILWMMLSFAWRNHPVRGMVQSMRARQAAEGKAKGGPLASGLFAGLKNKQLNEQQQQQVLQEQRQWELNRKQWEESLKLMNPQQRQKAIEQRQILEQKHLQNQQWQEQRRTQNQQWAEQRAVQNQTWQAQQEDIRRQRQQLQEKEGIGGNLANGLTGIVTKAWPYVQADLILGFLIWLGFTIGTGVYAKQLEIWLRLHQSGDAAKIRGLGLEGATVHENEGRRRPVL